MTHAKTISSSKWRLEKPFGSTLMDLLWTPHLYFHGFSYIFSSADSCQAQLNFRRFNLLKGGIRSIVSSASSHTAVSPTCL